MNLNQLSKLIHEANVKNGFYDGIDSIPEDYLIIKQLFLVISEITEAVEVLRKKSIDYSLSPIEHMGTVLIKSEPSVFEELYKDSFQDELADTFIRLLDLCGYLGIDIEQFIEAKLEYNATRPYKHGKKY